MISMKTCVQCQQTKNKESFKKCGWSKKTGERLYRNLCKKCYTAKYMPPTGKPNAGRYKKGNIPENPFKKGNAPWNLGKKMPLSLEVYKRIAAARVIKATGRHCLRNKQWRKACLERDEYRCQQCFTWNDLCVHHLKSFNDYTKLRFDVDNGITLCRSCHGRLHGKENCFVKNGVKFIKGQTPWNKDTRRSSIGNWTVT